MMTPQYFFILVSSAVFVDVILAFGLWLQWPEKIQRRTNGSGPAFLLLDLLGLPRIEQYCMALTTTYFVAGIILATVSAAAAFLLTFPNFIDRYL